MPPPARTLGRQTRRGASPRTWTALKKTLVARVQGVREATVPEGCAEDTLAFLDGYNHRRAATEREMSCKST